jgi:hypothetical protein
MVQTLAHFFFRRTNCVLGVYVYTINAHVLILTLYTQKRGKNLWMCIQHKWAMFFILRCVCIGEKKMEKPSRGKGGGWIGGVHGPYI